MLCEKENKNTITIEDIYNIKNRNYEWQSFKYQLPKKYHKNTEKKSFRSPSNIKRTNYIDDVLKQKREVPSPALYNIIDLKRPLSGKMDKSARMTLAAEILQKNKKSPSPGPTSYFTRPKTAEATISRERPQFKEHYLNEVEYHAAEAPGVGEYNINYFKTNHVQGPKISKSLKMIKNTVEHKSKTDKKQNLSQTVMYGTFQWIALQKKQKNKNFFGKSHRFQQDNKYEKKPGPNFYKLNHKWTDQSNILKTSSSFSNLKSVYYN